MKAFTLSQLGQARRGSIDAGRKAFRVGKAESPIGAHANLDRELIAATCHLSLACPERKSMSATWPASLLALLAYKSMPSSQNACFPCARFPRAFISLTREGDQGDDHRMHVQSSTAGRPCWAAADSTVSAFASEYLPTSAKISQKSNGDLQKGAMNMFQPSSQRADPATLGQITEVLAPTSERLVEVDR